MLKYSGKKEHIIHPIHTAELSEIKKVIKEESMEQV